MMMEENDLRTYNERFSKNKDELKWLYFELYNDEKAYDDLCKQMEWYYRTRSIPLKKLDETREQDVQWYKTNDMNGIMLYVDAFGKTLKGVKQKLDYIQNTNVNYIHLMPLLKTPYGRSDGGYAVEDYRNVQQSLGTMQDLSDLAAECHKRNISVCLDFVMNHTSEEHEWAKRARAGEQEYRERYFFYDSYNIPRQYDKVVPQVFPTTAPGNFTYLEDIEKFVMTTFYPYQWDLNYRNPIVFNEMMYNFLFLANQGMDIIRIDAVPYIWKELGTNCRNLPKVHTIVRMMRLIEEIVCPGVLLLGEVVMEPQKVIPYFGTVEKPECHMLYNVTTMATTWHSVATRDIRLLRNQMDIVSSLPKQYTYLNYLRCHDDIGWGLDYEFLKQFYMYEVEHKQFLNDFFTGKLEFSFSRGELYNEDFITKDARFCGTTASMCGIEKAGFERNQGKMKEAIQLDLMLHAYILSQSGIPMLYSGDEIAQVNDYTYKEDKVKVVDSRYIHRGNFPWELTKKIQDKTSVQGQIYNGIQTLLHIRKKEKGFISTATTYTVDTWDDSILCFIREIEEERIITLFNFSGESKIAWIKETGIYKDLISGTCMQAVDISIGAYGYYWLKQIDK